MQAVNIIHIGGNHAPKYSKMLYIDNTCKYKYIHYNCFSSKGKHAPPPESIIANTIIIMTEVYCRSDGGMSKSNVQSMA